MSATRALWAALVVSTVPSAVAAQTRCTSQEDLNRIEDARNRIFARPEQLDYEGAERGLHFAMRSCPTDPEVNALLGLAWLGMQRYVLAEQHLQAALTFHRDDEWWRQNRAVIVGRLGQLRQALGSVMVTVDAPGAVLHLPDERAVVLPMREPVRVPTGRFTIRVSAPGRADAMREVEVAPDGVVRTSMELRALPPAPVAPPRVSTVFVPVRVVRRASPLRTAGWITFGVGIASTVVGVVQLVRSGDQWNRAVAARGDMTDEWGAWARYSSAIGTRDGDTICSDAGAGASNDARAVQSLCADNQQTRVMAWVFTAVGFALAGGGAAMALLSHDHVEESSTTPRLSAMLGPNTRGLSLEVPFR